jgi:hypothetical protein
VSFLDDNDDKIDLRKEKGKIALYVGGNLEDEEVSSFDVDEDKRTYKIDTDGGGSFKDDEDLKKLSDDTEALFAWAKKQGGSNDESQADSKDDSDSSDDSGVPYDPFNALSDDTKDDEESSTSVQEEGTPAPKPEYKELPDGVDQESLSVMQWVEHADKCITAQDSSSGGSANADTCDVDDTLQMWNLPQSSSGPISSGLYPKLCMEVEGGANQDDVKVIMAACADGDTNQVWTIQEPDKGEGQIAWATNPDKCLAVASLSEEDDPSEAPGLVIKSCLETGDGEYDSQNWRLAMAGSKQ